MILRAFASFVLVALMAGAPSGCSAAAAHHNRFQGDADPISGEWAVAFKVQGTTTPATFKFKLEGNKVTGTAESAHTGPGTLRDGSWQNGNLSFTLDFKTHESIAVTGGLKDGKLIGKFSTEGFESDWEATKKTATTEMSAPAPSSDPISGEWNATFEAQGVSAPITFRFKLDGERVAGTSESSHLGRGTVTNSSWLDHKISFTIEGAQGKIAVKGVLKDGKLGGEFDAGQFKGTWTANKR